MAAVGHSGNLIVGAAFVWSAISKPIGTSTRSLLALALTVIAVPCGN